MRSQSDRSDPLDAPLPGIVGVSPAMREVYRLTRLVGPTSASILLIGETGTGNELLARAIHANSSRSAGPYIPVDCAALPEPLLESELFGHERGAFTGAVALQRGLLEMANGGTLFLDELEELSLTTQAKLLRALEERQVRRVGGQAFVDLDLRVIAATHQDLSSLVAAKKFRGDLFYRLNVLNIRVPPLRERTGDIALLAEHFLQTFARRAARPVVGISEAALLILEHYPWPGNVRELRNTIERAVAITTEPYVSPLDLPGEMLTRSQQMPAVFRQEKRKSVENFERQSITEALTRTQGNVTEAARICGMDRAALHRLMRKYGIESRLYRSASSTGRD